MSHLFNPVNQKQLLPFHAFNANDKLKTVLKITISIFSEQKIIKKQKMLDLGVDKIAGETRATGLAEVVDDSVHLGFHGASLLHQYHCLCFQVRCHHFCFTLICWFIYESLSLYFFSLISFV